MSGRWNQLSISISLELENKLEAVQQKYYSQSSQNDMLLDLIRLGLIASQKQKEEGPDVSHR